MKLFTIGFTRSSAEHFFGRLRRAGVKRIVDVRLSNSSQLAGFAKRDDLAYFARALCGMEYAHRPDLAPTQALFDGYKKRKGPWDDFERAFLDLMAERRIEDTDPALLDGGCLLCSEDKPHRCHRRLVAEYLRGKWPGMDIEHL